MIKKQQLYFARNYGYKKHKSQQYDNTYIAGDKNQFLDLFLPFSGPHSASWRQLKRAVVT